MEKKFWFVTLCVFLIIASFAGLSVPLRIAIIGNAIVILIEVCKKFMEVLRDREAKN